MELDQWECVPGVCETPGAEGLAVFGVRVTHPDGSVWTWPDVDVDRAAVCRLAAMLQETQPERCHYQELVLDFIQRQAEYPR